MDSEEPSAAQHDVPAEPAPVPADQLSINLKIFSPSLSQPVTLPDVPAASTVTQLKERIRQELPTRPADNHQRLIYRGRMINRPDEKLLDLFGEDMIRSSAQQSMHLIIPDKTDSPSTTTPARGPSPALAPRGQDSVNPTHQYFDSVLQQRARHVGRGVPAAAATTPGHVPTGTQSTPGMAPVTDHYHHQHHPAMPLGSHPAAPQMYRGQPTPAQFTAQGFQQMAHRLSREAAIHRAYLNQWDRTGGVPGARTPQPRATSPLEAAQRRPSPGPNHDTYPTPESLHQRFRGPGAETSLSDAEVQNILRGADARQAILNMTNAMQRSASGTSLGPQSGRATPGTSSPAPSGTGAAAAPPPTSSSSQPHPDVYILYSPTGPRALLINPHTSETYYTPPAPARSTSHTPFFGLPNLPAFRPNSIQTGTPDQPTPATEQSERDFEDQGDAQARLRRRVRVRINQPAAEAGPGRPHHPGAAAIIARIWPHFWLAFRLGLFVWWFTSPASSWSRWLAVIGIAVAIFVLNTGALDGFADTVWRVVCRHMEDLIPMVDPNRPREANRDEEQNQAPQRGPRGEEPQPGDIATRLVRERRRGNASWLMERVRGMERLGILLLASFAPGVAERHIANLEAEAERQRREVEAVEEARRAAEEAAAEAEAANIPAEIPASARSSEPAPPPHGEVA